jgi:hypothetical protein
MSKPQKFVEYLNAKGGGKKDDVGEKPKVAKVADYTGPQKNSPPQGGGAYAAANGKAPKGTGSDDLKKGGFASKGDKKLVYEPKTENAYERDRIKTKTQEWLDKTRDLSLSEFAKEIKASAVVEGKSPTNNIRQTVANCQLNPNLIESLLREFKRAEMLESVVAQLFQHPEAYQELAKLMEGSEDGVLVARRLVRAVNEIVGPPAHELDDEDEDGEELGDGPDMGDEEDMGDEDMDDMDMDGDDEDMDMGDEDMDMGDEDMDMGDEDMGGDLDAPMPHKKHGGHMLDAMPPKKHGGNMLDAMKSMMR